MVNKLKIIVDATLCCDLTQQNNELLHHCLQNDTKSIKPYGRTPGRCRNDTLATTCLPGNPGLP